MDIPGYLSLNWAYALLPGIALVWLYVKRLKNRNLWRVLLLVIAIILLGYPSFVRSDKSFDLFLVVDRSRSISEESRAKEREILDMVSGRLRPGDRLGVVSFNQRAYIEQISDSKTPLKAFNIPYSEDASDLTEGLDLALSQCSGSRPARLFVLSDGEYTGLDPAQAAQMARQKNIPIYYRSLQRLDIFNLSVRSASAPDQILTGEPHRVTFVVDASADAPGRYRILRDGQVMGRDKNEGWRAIAFKSGENTIPFTDTLPTPGIHSYKIEVESVPYDKEKTHADNTAERFVKAIGERPVLLVNNTGQADNVSRVLSAGNIPCHIANISAFRLTPELLTGYKSIILNNVPALSLTVTQMTGIRNFVQQEGGGLMVCGGNRSFSMGGYYKCELEPLLPVSLEDRQRSKKVSTAFSIALDRSGSMAMTTPSGVQKIALATNAASECVNLLSPADSISIIAEDSIAHIVVPQQNNTNPASICSQTRSIESMGGGIFIYDALQAAGREILQAKQLNKHILLFADAADSEEPGDYKNLVADFVKSGVTVSVVGLGTEHDKDAELLKDIAKIGKGSVYFTEDAAQLTQFFTADAITYTRNSFVTEPAPMKIRSGSLTVSPGHNWTDFSCAGYNLLFVKPDAEIAIQTVDEDQAPTLAFWQKELGRVAAFAFDTDGAFANQKQFGDILLSSVRWIMGSNVEDNLQIRTTYEGNYARIRMEVSDQERAAMGAATLQLFTPDGKTITRPLSWDSLNQLSSTAKLEQTGCYRGVIQAGGKTYRIPPISLPVSPELAANRPPDFGKNKLVQLATLTEGREIMDVRDLFERTQTSHVVSPVVRPFLILFLVLMLLEIAEPRFGVLGMLRKIMRSSWGFLRRRRQPKTALATQGSSLVHSATETTPLARVQEEKRGDTVASADAPAVSPAASSDMDYLRHTKRQFNRNMRKPKR